MDAVPLLLLGFAILGTSPGPRAPWLAAPTSGPTSRWAGVPGVVVDHLPSRGRAYIGSPSLLRRADGTLLVKHDQFGPGSTERQAGVTDIFRSDDRGAHWSAIARVQGLYWSTLFEHRGVVYQIGVTREYGALVCVRSDDGGRTWTTPTDPQHGLLRPGAWHTAPVPVIGHDGRLWRGVEDGEGAVPGPGGAPGKRNVWGAMFRPRMMSAPADANLLDAASWTITDPLDAGSGGWLANAGAGGTPVFKFALEGNAVLSPDGSVWDVLRTDRTDQAGTLRISPDGRHATPVLAGGVGAFGGTDKKFEIRWDEPSRLYWAIANPVLHEDSSSDPGGTRNTLALLSSPDLKSWATRRLLLHHANPAKYAFQYASWTTDGEDLLVASRTAYDDGEGVVPRGHDANFLTFHRFPGFRKDPDPGR